MLKDCKFNFEWEILEKFAPSFLNMVWDEVDSLEKMGELEDENIDPEADWNKLKGVFEEINKFITFSQPWAEKNLERKSLTMQALVLSLMIPVRAFRPVVPDFHQNLSETFEGIGFNFTKSDNLEEFFEQNKNGIERLTLNGEINLGKIRRNKL